MKKQNKSHAYLREVISNLSNVIVGALLITLWVVSFGAQAQTITIEGTLTLPNPAPATGIDFNMQADDDTLAEASGNQIISFGFMETARPFSITVDDNGMSRWRITANCSANCDNHMDFVVYSTTSPNNGTLDFGQATLLVGGSNLPGINFSAKEANIISGMLTFPAGFPVPLGGVELHINSFDRNTTNASGGFELVGNEVVNVPPSSMSFGYTAKVVRDMEADIVLFVECFDFINTSGECDAYWQTSFYNSSGSVPDLDSATGLAGATDHPGINIDIIRGFTISGMISLPSGTAPAGGVDLDVRSFQNESPFLFGTHFDATIAAGSSSTDYSNKVPMLSPASNWILEAECVANCAPYEQFTYPTSAGSSHIFEQAMRFTNNQNYPGTDFSLAARFSGSLPVCDALLDDFSGASMDLDDWFDPETSREVSGGKLVLSQRLISSLDRDTFFRNQRFRLGFNGITPNDIQAKVAVMEADLTSSGTGTAFARIAGVYYNTTVSPVDDTGNIFVELLIGDRGAGLEAWWEMFESLNGDFSNFTIVDTETLIAPGTLLLNTEYDVRLEFDGDNTFTFTVNGASSTANGPVNMSDALFPDRHFASGVAPADNSDSDPISSMATFDDVRVNGVLFDDFSAGIIDEAKWNEFEAKRELNSGKMRAEVTAESSIRRTVFTQTERDVYKDATCVHATLNLRSTSNIPGGTRGRARIEGYWYNALFNQTTGYNNFEGTVYAQLVLEQTESGQLRGTAYAEQADDADYNSATQLGFHVFDTPVSLDTDYAAAVELDKANNRLLFRFANEVWVLPILTAINSGFPFQDYNGITARVQSGPGALHAEFDDVRITLADLDGDGDPDLTDPDDDGDGMTDVFELDNGLNPLDPSDAAADSDNDTLSNLDEFLAGTEIDDPDTDGDGVGDAHDPAPTAFGNLCAGDNPVLQNVSISSVEVCSGNNSITADDPTEVQFGGSLYLVAPTTELKSGFSVKSGGRLNVRATDPCPACPP